MKKNFFVLVILFIQLIYSSVILAEDICRKEPPGGLLSTMMVQATKGIMQGLSSSIQCGKLTPREKAEEYQRHLTLRYESLIHEVNAMFTYFSVAQVGEVTIAEKSLIKELYDTVIGLIPGASTVWSIFNSTISLASELGDTPAKSVNPIHRLEQLRESFVIELEKQQRKINEETFVQQLECAFTPTSTVSSCAPSSIGKLSCNELFKIKDEKMIAQSKAKFQAAFARVVAQHVRIENHSGHFEITLEVLNGGARFRSNVQFVGYGAEAILCKLAKDPAILRYGNNDIPIEVLGLHADVYWNIGQFEYRQIINSHGKQEGELYRFAVTDQNYLEIEPFLEDVQALANRSRGSTSMINIWNLTEHCR